MTYKIYTKDDCPWCARAKTLMSTYGFDFEELKLGVDFNNDWYKREISTTYPHIVKDGVDIGGYMQLEQLVMDDL